MADNNSDNRGDRTIVGFDFGHAETALARVSQQASVAPQMIDLPGAAKGSRQIVTAVARNEQDGVVLGEAAISLPNSTEKYLAFKSPDFANPDVRYPMQLFVSAVLEQATAERKLPPSSEVDWFFGAPSGWSRSLLANYAVLFEEAGFPGATVVPESRAAMLYARDSREVKIDANSKSSMLVIDLGSSTTDLTRVDQLSQRALSDHGVELGARMLDMEIRRRVLERHPKRAELETIVQIDRHASTQLEFLCRRVKESLFRKGTEALRDPNESAFDTDRIPPRGKNSEVVTIELTAAEMDEVLDTPLSTLGGLSWRDSFRQLLEQAREEGDPPDAVLLTGGASRMHFVADVAREVFGDHRVHVGAEPEAAIARGLALAGLVNYRAEQFREEVQELINGTEIEDLVNDNLADLARRLGEAAADGAVERHVIPAMLKWRRSEIDTLDDLAERVASEIHGELTSPTNTAINQVILDWQAEIRPDVDDLTSPICRRWDIPPSQLQLRSFELGDRNWATPDVSSATGSAAGIDGMLAAVSAAIAGVLATTMFGAGMAIVASTGPVGWIIGAVVLFMGIFGGGRDAAMKKARASSLPPWVRQLKGEDGLATSLRASASEQERELAEALAGQFLQDGGPVIAAQLTTSIGQQLAALANETLLDIKVADDHPA